MHLFDKVKSLDDFEFDCVVKGGVEIKIYSCMDYNKCILFCVYMFFMTFNDLNG